MIDDVKLTENFSLFELTVTNKAGLQDLNRMLTSEQIVKLTEVAKMLEQIRAFIGKPLIVTSAYRCPEVNKAVGSSDHSQHLLCEAADFVPSGMDIGDGFRDVWRIVKHGDLKVGQLIFETAERGDSFTSWIHVSLGQPYRDQSRCQQVLRMEHGKYRMLV